MGQEGLPEGEALRGAERTSLGTRRPLSWESAGVRTGGNERYMEEGVEGDMRKGHTAHTGLAKKCGCSHGLCGATEDFCSDVNPSRVRR